MINRGEGVRMPEYTFFNTESGMEWDDFMSISEKEEFLKDNPKVEQVLSTMNIVSGVGGIRNDAGWGEVLQKTAEAHPGSELAASMGSKQSTKEVKTRQAVEKWRKSRAAKGG
jgi:hypothetical protein